LPNHIIAAAVPLILTVDWIIARARSGVNVMSDMLVAILLDRWRHTPATEPIPLLSGSSEPNTTVSR
jgi:Na+/H+-dicarboxylate symporter